MTGPWWELGQGVHCSSTVPPAFTVADLWPFVAFRWQMISGFVYAAGAMKPLLVSSGIDQPTTTGCSGFGMY